MGDRSGIEQGAWQTTPCSASPAGSRRTTLYHEEGRTTDEVAAEDWSNFLAHVDAIDFFTRPDPALLAPDTRIFHVTTVAGERSRELAVNDPFEASELVMLIRLVRRALRDRLVLSPETLSDEVLEAIRAGLSNPNVEARTGPTGRLIRRPGAHRKAGNKRR